MIPSHQLLALAREWQLRPEVVEKDYVLGWVLAAFSTDPETSANWILKGGTCLKKCIVETYRFSEDLDFSLTPEAGYTEAHIHELLLRIANVRDCCLTGIVRERWQCECGGCERVQPQQRFRKPGDECLGISRVRQLM